MTHFSRYKTYYLSVAAFFLLAGISHGATITVSSSSIVIDTEGQSVNAVELQLGFDPAEFSVQSVSNGGSVINAWITEPAFSNEMGTLEVSGIIPGGANTSAGKILSFVLGSKKQGISKGFTLKNAQILLNDGKGTAAKVSFKSDSFSFAKLSVTVSEGQNRDIQAPDSFIPEVASDPNIFDGSYFLVFSTTDQGTGIDHYEVLEAPQGSISGDLNAWQTASSPYLLHDQSLSSDIYVRAIDRAGNLRMVKLGADEVMRQTLSVPRKYAWLEFASGILLIGICLYLWKKRSHG